ncbi:MAG: fibronectin type III domain-containing protein [candidate division KSB1 bacterium]|nr:fibronectin type III domain-containing protein [candidate division KSB1 bacterium]
MRKYHTILVMFVLFFSGCSEHLTDNPKPNQPPETKLFLYPDSTLRTTTSRQILHWSGDDPDGKVVRYIHTWNPDAPIILNWTEFTKELGWDSTSANCDTFALKFLQIDTTYTFRVSAVDDQGAIDPTPAQMSFPVANTPPVVEFTIGMDVPETTFTVASFSWRGTDLDGDDTIKEYQWVLDDTNQTWHSLGALINFITLTADSGLTAGDHVFYLKAIDNAGVASAIIRMPKKDKVWYVREPLGDLLLIDDYDPLDNSAIFYKTILDTLVGQYSVWDIKIDRNRDNRNDFLPSSVVTFTQTLLLFQRVIWYADDTPHLEQAQISVPIFLKQGGKIIFSTRFKEFFSEQGDPLDFSPADSLGVSISRIFNNTVLKAQKPGFPELKVKSSGGIIPFVKALIPKPSAQVVYTLESSSQWPGNPVMALENAETTFFFCALPIHQLDGNGNVGVLIKKILKEEFGAP